MNNDNTAEAKRVLALPKLMAEAKAKTPAPAIGKVAHGNTDFDTIHQLAALSPLEYDRRREAEAKQLGCKVATLDKLVDAKRPKSNDGALQGVEVALQDVDPWPEAVNGASVLNEVAKAVSEYLVLPEGTAEAIALWCAHAHAFEAFIHTPRLNFYAPEMGCGKTTGLDVVATLTPRALRTENITAPILFRLVEAQRPTLLLDEADKILHQADELCGLLNAGHKRGAMALRCEGENNVVRGFRAFAPAAIAGIGALPGTLTDRSIMVRLVRAKPDEIQVRFDPRRTEREAELNRKLARWASENFDQLKKCDPQLPQTAFNRVADNWRPLFAVAEVAGGDWPERAHNAFNKLTSTDRMDGQSIRVMLLADIKAVFTEKDTDGLPSGELAEALAEIEGRPWAEWGRMQKPITANQLARQLSHFCISPDRLRINEQQFRGYKLEDFREAFDRYIPSLPDVGDPNRHSVTKSDFTRENQCDTSENTNRHTVSRGENDVCDGVTVRRGGARGSRTHSLLADLVDRLKLDAGHGLFPKGHSYCPWGDNWPEHYYPAQFTSAIDYLDGDRKGDEQKAFSRLSSLVHKIEHEAIMGTPLQTDRPSGLEWAEGSFPSAFLTAREYVRQQMESLAA
jgi:putative DNA primase/helicase